MISWAMECSNWLRSSSQPSRFSRGSQVLSLAPAHFNKKNSCKIISWTKWTQYYFTNFNVHFLQILIAWRTKNLTHLVNLFNLSKNSMSKKTNFDEINQIYLPFRRKFSDAKFFLRRRYLLYPFFSNRLASDVSEVKRNNDVICMMAVNREKP